MVVGKIRSGTELGRGVMRGVGSFFEKVGGFVTGLAILVVFGLGLFCFSRQAVFEKHHGFDAIWHFTLAHGLVIALIAVAVIVVAGGALWLNSYIAKIVGTWIVTLLILYVCSYAFYEIAAFVFQWISRTDALFLAVYYPLAGFFWLALTTITLAFFVGGFSSVMDDGPTLPLSTILYVVMGFALFLGVNYASELVSHALGTYENMGIYGAVVALFAVTTLALTHVLGRKYVTRFDGLSKARSIAGACVYLCRCFISIFDVIFTIVFGGMAVGLRTPVLRFALLTALYAVPSLIALWAAGAPQMPLIGIRLDPMIVLGWMMFIPCAVTIGVYRRSAMLDDIRRRSLLVSRQDKGYRIAVTGDLQTELLACGYLLFFTALPTTLYVVNSVTHIFAFTNSTAPRFVDFVGWVSNQLVRDVAVVRSLGEAVGHPAGDALVQQKGPPLDFYVRLIAEVTVVAAILQALNRNGDDARQREQFEDRDDPVDRLDILAERDLFRAAAQDWSVVDRMPRYDPRRLQEIISGADSYKTPEDYQEIHGAARVAGYQVAADALEKVLSIRLPRVNVDATAEFFRRYDQIGNRQYPSDTDSTGKPSADLADTDPRKRCAKEALAGLERRFDLLEALSPDAEIVKAALDNFGKPSYRYSKKGLDDEIRELKRKSEIYAVLEALDDAASEQDGWAQYLAANRLESLVKPEDMNICRALAADKTPWREEAGVALLGAMGEDADNERILLEKITLPEKVAQPQLPWKAWNSLAKMGTEITVTAIGQRLKAEPQSKFGVSYSSLVRTLTAIALRKADARDEVRQMLKILLTVDYPAWARYAALKGLYFLYDGSLDIELLTCASHGYSGPDYRSDQRKKRDEAITLEIRLLAIFLLGRSPNQAAVRAALQKLKEAAENNKVHMPLLKRLRNSVRHLLSRMGGDHGAPWYDDDDDYDYDDNKKLIKALDDAITHIDDAPDRQAPGAMADPFNGDDFPDYVLARVFFHDPKVRR